MDIITKAFRRKTHKKDVARSASFDVKDWPQGTALIRAARGNLPILARPSLTERELQVVGIASADELFASLGCQQIMMLFNPLGKVSDSGIWCHVQLLDGKQGWIMA